MNTAPHFDLQINTTVKNIKTGKIYNLQSVDPLRKFTGEDYESIKNINNEPNIYIHLHKEKFDNKPYDIAHAKGSIEKSQETWENKQKYEFFVRNLQNKIIAAIDIKTIDNKSAEIGYWASEFESGIMTNTVIKTCDLAKEVSFKTLYAYTDLDNLRSQNVLLRSGFKNMGEVENRGKRSLKFLKTL